jgi:lipoate-protein ligase B
MSCSSVRPVVVAQWLGRLPYGKALSMQQARVSELIAAKKLASTAKVNHLLLLEHSPVYTVGLRSHVYSESEEKRLRALGAEFYRCTSFLFHYSSIRIYFVSLVRLSDPAILLVQQ